MAIETTHTVTVDSTNPNVRLRIEIRQDSDDTSVSPMLVLTEIDPMGDTDPIEFNAREFADALRVAGIPMQIPPPAPPEFPATALGNPARVDLPPRPPNAATDASADYSRPIPWDNFDAQKRGGTHG